LTGTKATVSRVASNQIDEADWGRLEWMVAGWLGNSDTMTVGRCYIDPGCANPRHHHPNCDEILVVIHGSVEHSAGDELVALDSGDAISIPAGVVHNARNVGEDQAFLLITFSSAYRETVKE
jgi:quercetin dioxygenase-like cupin family protein